MTAGATAGAGAPGQAVCLALDTSGPYCAAAVLADGKFVAERFDPMARGQAEHLLGMAQEMLTGAGLCIADINLIGVGTGPGNFTGIRIAVAAARGLALGRAIRAIGVSRFDVVRHSAAPVPTPPHTPAVTAPRDQLYLHPDGMQPFLASAEEAARYGSLALYDETANPAPAIARIAAARLHRPDERPAPLYIKAADAAPPREAAPRILS